MSKVRGFDYQRGHEVELTRTEVRQRMSDAIKGGGRRRVENGETFVHAKGSRIVLEIYANISHLQQTAGASHENPV